MVPCIPAAPSMRNGECESVSQSSSGTPDSETSTCRSFPDVPGTPVLTGYQEHQFRNVVESMEMLINSEKNAQNQVQSLLHSVEIFVLASANSPSSL